MSLTALLSRCLLALALMANGLPAMAMPTQAEPATAADGSCHDVSGHAAAAGDQVAPTAPMDCCDSGDCACSCLHHAPVVLGLAFMPAKLPPRAATAITSGRLAPGPLRSPSLRPPIIG